MHTNFSFTRLLCLAAFKKNARVLAVSALAFGCFSKVHAQTFSSIINVNNGATMIADNDNSSPIEDFIWILDQNSWTNGSSTEKMRLGSSRLWLNTAFSMPSTHEFAIDAPGIVGGRFTVKSNGNIGIGAASPVYKLVVSNATHSLSINPHGAGIDIHSTGNFAPHYQTDFTIYKGDIGSGVAKFRIDADGRVGIGTTAPSARLTVTGDGTYSNDILTNGRIWTGANSTAGGMWVNSISNVPTQLFGTYDNATKMGLYNNNRWNLVADSAGNVGIGTTSPTARLEVSGQVRITGGTPGAGKVLTSDANGLASWMTNTSSQWALSGANITYASGNVGIGTTSASQKLVVSNGTSTLSFAPHTAGVDIHSTGNFAPHYQTNFTIYKGNLGFGVPKFTINTDGNVGIGTSTPGKGKLHVVGSLHVENTDGRQTFHVSAGQQLVFVGDSAYIKYLAALSNPSSPIQSDSFSLWVSKGIVTEDLAFAGVDTWADYVFADNYELPALEKLATFVKINKHLPNIPSEAAVKKNGYSVHQMNQGFLKSIEELTLYAIGQNQQIKTLEAEIAAQKVMLGQYEKLAAEVEKLKVVIASLQK